MQRRIIDVWRGLIRRPQLNQMNEQAEGEPLLNQEDIPREIEEAQMR